MQSTSINLSTLKAYSMKSFPFGLIPWILSDQRLGRHGSWSRGERAMNGMCVTVRLSLQKCLLGLWKFMTPNGKQHVLKIREFFRGNQPTDFRDEFPSAKIPQNLLAERRHQSWQQRNNSLPFPEAAVIWQIGLFPPSNSNSRLSRGPPTLNTFIVLPVYLGRRKNNPKL